MLGTGNGHGWPRHGEIDIVEAVNGDPTVHMATHSTNHHSGHPQHPPKNPFYAYADFTKVWGKLFKSILGVCLLILFLTSRTL